MRKRGTVPRDTNPRRAARRARKKRRFPDGTVCVFCGFSNPDALIAVSRTLLEEHHVFGLCRDDDTRIPLCKICHALLTEDMLVAGVSMRSSRSLLETLAEVHR